MESNLPTDAPPEQMGQAMRGSGNPSFNRRGRSYYASNLTRLATNPHVVNKGQQHIAKGVFHGDNTRQISRSARHQEGLREYRDRNEGRLAAGNARMVRLHRRQDSREHCPRSREIAHAEAGCARSARDNGSRQRLPFRTGSRTCDERNGKRRQRAYRFARKEIPRPGQVPDACEPEPRAYIEDTRAASPPIGRTPAFVADS